MTLFHISLGIMHTNTILLLFDNKRDYYKFIINKYLFLLINKIKNIYLKNIRVKNNICYQILL